MIIYEATKEEFMNDVTDDSIAVKIHQSYLQKIGKVSISEINSWNNSMNYMYKVLNTPMIPDDVGIALEYKIPRTSNRIDFMLTGLDEQDRYSVVIVELKQWSEVNLVANSDGLVETYLNGGLRKKTHPSYQAYSYAKLITDYNESVQNEPISLYPCAYLHNYIQKENDPITDNLYENYLSEAPVFIKGDALKLRGFISTYIKKTDRKKSLYLIELGKIRPSKSLQDALLQMLNGNEEFMMIEEQKVVYEEAIVMAIRALSTDRKQVLIVEGGPGTGKSVLAINLLVQLTSQEMVCQYVTKNSAPREVYTKRLQRDYKKTFINNLFKSSGVYHEALPNELDVLIVDEAHRLNEKSGLFKNKGENQMMEIIRAAKCSIFFIDEYQKVSMHDAGNKEQIKQFAELYNAEVVEMQLESQFRCNGSDGYLAWLDDVLELRKTANADGFDFQYDFKIFDNPNELRNEIFNKNQINNKARMLAGYCWDWKTEGKNNPEVHDIYLEEHQFSMSWNLNNTTTWAIDPESVEQIGCIHTSQGLEFDYVGVIIGEDLRYVNGEIVTDPFKRARTDKSLSGFKTLYKKDSNEAMRIADQIIKNTYRTLLTRGMKGCYIYCVDPLLAEYLKNRLKRMRREIVYPLYQERTLMVAEEKTRYETGGSQERE
ncbi:RecBCD enzyme subunit RecD [compost metagenome]